MKKSLVLAMAMALGVTASAYAANPFSDVPAGHWAYDAVNKLAAEGVVDGYPDGTYGGDKLMTRYEMAQIVAKAMAKGANVDKLAAEFADELDSLGVRVANLEKKADNVKITGQIRMSYRDTDVDKHDGKGLSQGRLRTRLFVNGAINEDWTYTGRFENNQYLDDNKGTDDVELNWAYVTGKVGGVKVEAGRQDFTNVGGTVIDTRGDGIKLAYGKDIKVYGWALKGSDDLAEVADDPSTPVDESAEGLTSDDRVYVAGVSAKMGVVDAAVNYYKVDTEYDQDIYEIAAGWEFMDDLTLKGAWYNGDVSDSNGDDNGWMVGLNYAGAKASKVGSWGAYVNYMDRPWNTVIYPTLASYTSVPETLVTDVDGDGYKGIEAGANLTLAKNIVAGVKYYNLDSREGDANTETIWSEVIFTF